MEKYLLRRSVHLCFSGEQVVFLDLHRDRYLARNIEQVRALTCWVQGWPRATASTNNLPSEDSAANVIRLMTAENLLTSDPSAGKVAALPSVPQPRATLTVRHPASSPRIRIRHVAVFMRALLLSTIQLRCLGIERAVRAVTNRRAIHRARSHLLDIPAAAALVNIYQRLRLFTYSSRDACLFDSLTLIHFLAAFDVCPQWIFGVETAPFAAHCWVQHGEVTFNDSVEHACIYTPILAA